MSNSPTIPLNVTTALGSVSTTPTTTIRNISQSAQEREIVKTAPDIIVYIEGLPYLLNAFVNDRRNNQSPAIVNFNDHVTSFSCNYDTELMVPSGSIGFQVPNHQKYLYQMPGGNNLIQPMMQVQVYAKGYFFTANGDTIYRRIFKGLVSHVSYNDNGKTYEISMQCYGILYLLELMQINLNPSMLTVAQTGSAPTYFSTRFAMLNPYKQIAAAFIYGLSSDGFQLNNLTQTAAINGEFGQAVALGYINKWQAILKNLQNDVHIYGVDFKDSLGITAAAKIAEDETKSDVDKTTRAVHNAIHSTSSESQEVEQDMYYGKIQEFLPTRQVQEVDLRNNQIVNRLELIRKMVHLIDFEAYQDLDGKIIVKPPLYNLDVTDIGIRTTQTSTVTQSSTLPTKPVNQSPSTSPDAFAASTATGTTQTPSSSSTSQNSYTNPLTAIYPNTNPFIVYLAEILTEQESEDQAAVRRTRTVCSGNVDVSFQFGYNEELKATAEWVDIPKLLRYGLREEPVINVPWLGNGTTALYAHAIAETVRSNRGFRTYTVTIPLRPELKLGFPIYFPHRDIYGYIKSIAINYQVSATATMTITCDSIRRRVLVNTPSGNKNPDGTPITYYTSAPNLVLTRAFAPPSGQVDNTYVQSMATGISQGGYQPTGQPNLTSLAGTVATQPDTSITSQVSQPSAAQKAAFVRGDTDLGLHSGIAPDQAGPQFAQYFIQNDGSVKSGTKPNPIAIIPNEQMTGTLQVPRSNLDGYYTKKRPVDDLYFFDLKYSTVIPYTDDYGYELISPFPWGRWIDLNRAIKEFTEKGWVKPPTDANGNPVSDPQELAILQNTDVFLYAGMGTPSAQGNAANALSQKFSQITNAIGGSFTPSAGSKPNTVTPDTTVFVLTYTTTTGSTNDSSLLTTPQPEDNVIQSQIMQTANAAQQLVNVLVSGSISPVPAAQAALLATQTQTPFNTISIGSTPAQKAQQALVFSGTPVTVTTSITPTPGGGLG